MDLEDSRTDQGVTICLGGVFESKNNDVEEFDSDNQRIE